MKASELIAELQKLITDHGDLPVALADWNEGHNPPVIADNIKLGESGNIAPAQKILAFVIN